MEVIFRSRLDEMPCLNASEDPSRLEYIVIVTGDDLLQGWSYDMGPSASSEIDRDFGARTDGIPAIDQEDLS